MKVFIKYFLYCRLRSTPSGGPCCQGYHAASLRTVAIYWSRLQGIKWLAQQVQGPAWTRQATSISRQLPKDAEEKILQFHHLIIDLYDQHDYRPRTFSKWMRCHWNSTWSATAPYRREDCAAVYKWCWEEGLHLHLDHGCWWHQAPSDSRYQGETRPKDERSWSPRHWAEKRHHPRGSLPEVDHHNSPQGEWRPSLSVGVGQLPCSYHWVCQRSLVSQTDVAIIPGGLTHVLQPLDVSINHPFKHLVHNEWLEWTSGTAEYTKWGSHHLQSKELVCTWITKAWKEVDIAIITNMSTTAWCWNGHWDRRGWLHHLGQQHCACAASLTW